MGQMKRERERLDGLRDAATEILLKTGALRTHRNDDSVLINQLDDASVSDAYALGTQMVKAGEVDGTRKELMEAIKEVINDARV